MNVYVGGEDVRTRDGLDTAVRRRRPAHPPAGDGRWKLERSAPDVAPRPRRVDAARRAAAALAEAVRPPVREARRTEPERFDQGPRREGDARRRRGVGRARAGTPPARADEREHRDRARARRASARLSADVRACPSNVTAERRRLLELYGAEIVESPGEEGSNGAVRLALELAERDPSFFMPFQYANEANPRAHYEGTGAEIAAALDRVDVLVAGPRHRRDAHGRRRAAARVVPRRRRRSGRAAARATRSWASARSTTATCRRSSTCRSSTGSCSCRTPRRSSGLRLLLEREGVLGGVSSGAVDPRGAAPRGRARRGRRSCACSRTAAGSTCPRTSGTPRTSRASMERSVWW